MKWLELFIDWCVYLIIGFSIFGLFMGVFKLINLVFIRGSLW
jgi:hypothetical protein